MPIDQHVCTGRSRWPQGKPAWEEQTLIRCVGWLGRVKVSGSKVRGERMDLPKGPWKPSVTGFDLFTGTQAPSAGPHRQLRGGWSHKDFPSTNQDSAFSLNQHKPAVTICSMFMGTLKSVLGVFVFLFYLHCRSLSATLVTYAGGGSLSSSEGIRRSAYRGLRRRRRRRRKSILCERERE